MASKYKKLVDDIEKTKDLSDENAKELAKAIEDFKTSSSY
jgi:F-type H+-transporting ATPase subunit alpha